jgi:hypothetical protein
VRRIVLGAADEQTAALSKPFSSKIDVPNVQYDRRHTGNHDGITDFVRRRPYLLHEPSEERGTARKVGQDTADFPMGASEASEMLPGNVLPWSLSFLPLRTRTGPGTRPGGTRSRAAATCVEQRRWKAFFSRAIRATGLGPCLLEEPSLTRAAANPPSCVNRAE